VSNISFKADGYAARLTPALGVTRGANLRRYPRARIFLALGFGREFLAPYQRTHSQGCLAQDRFSPSPAVRCLCY
jgi:hypothetical protein